MRRKSFNHSTGKEVIITKKGKPVVVICPFNEREFEFKGAKYGKGKRSVQEG